LGYTGRLFNLLAFSRLLILQHIMRVIDPVTTSQFDAQT